MSYRKAVRRTATVTLALLVGGVVGLAELASRPQPHDPSAKK